MSEFERLKSELQQISALIDPAIREDHFPEQIEPAELRSAVRTYPELGGKRLRPALLLWAGRLFGAEYRTLLPAACAVEIYHNWTLVHDDIIDCDDVRRGHPTSHREIASSAERVWGTKRDIAEKYGHDLAILAGDIQQSWAIESMMRLTDNGVPESVVFPLVKLMQNQLNRELISGEALDVSFALRDPDTVTEQEVMHMISGKTGAILRYSVTCGAAAAKGHYDPCDPDIIKLNSYAADLALAFQLQDDMLGIFGDEKTFGKPIGSDFQESKPTLLYLAARHALDHAGKAKLSSMTGLKHYGELEINTIRNLLTESGAADTIRRQIRDLSDRSIETLQELPAHPCRENLSDLVSYLVVRTV